MGMDSSTNHRTVLREKALSDYIVYHDDVGKKSTKAKEAVNSYNDTSYTTSKMKLPTLAGGFVTTNMKV